MASPRTPHHRRAASIRTRVPGHNNGSVQQIDNNLDSSRSMAFTYDSLNRISQANTVMTTGNNCWGESYTIDAWGNLTNISGPPNMPGCHTEGPNNPVGVNNQISGWCYDAAGNLLDMGGCAPAAHSFVYDAEGHLQSPPAVGAGATALAFTYYYDGDGNRVQKCNANPCTSGSPTSTLYWLGAAGEVLNESSRVGTMQEEYIYFNGQRIARRDLPSGSVHYYFSNHLGSASLIADSGGNIQQQTDYYPYGGIAYTSGLDSNRYKFTGKERDAESSLDNFGARYFAANVGRFMTPDDGSDQQGLDPQSWNLYAYVRNNPLNGIDPTGHCADFSDGASATEITKVEWIGGTSNSICNRLNAEGGVIVDCWGPSWVCALGERTSIEIADQAAINMILFYAKNGVDTGNKLQGALSDAVDKLTTDNQCSSAVVTFLGQSTGGSLSLTDFIANFFSANEYTHGFNTRNPTVRAGVIPGTNDINLYPGFFAKETTTNENTATLVGEGFHLQSNGQMSDKLMDSLPASQGYHGTKYPSLFHGTLHNICE